MVLDAKVTYVRGENIKGSSQNPGYPGMTTTLASWTKPYAG
jgi:hypothetical protein